MAAEGAPVEPGDDTVVVGRIGRPHGVHGEVTIELRTDDPEQRFRPGAVLLTEPAERGPVAVAGRRWHREVLLLALDGVDSREAAEEFRDTLLLVHVAELPELDDPDTYYDHQLIGLAVRLPDGSPLGEIAAVRHEGTELLVVRRPDRGDLLVPFVAAIVPAVDLAGGFVTVDPPEGLLEL